MKNWSRPVTGLIVATAFAALTIGVRAETSTLELKKVNVSSSRGSTGPPPDYMFQQTYPQQFFQQLGGPAGMIMRAEAGEKPAFSEVIKREPKYVSETPFRGVAQLGSRFYGFVVDAAQAAKEAKPNASAEADASEAAPLQPLVLNRLYFDLNGNGDLTDDPPIAAEEGSGYESATADYAYSNTQFPVVELTIDVDGTSVDYAFRFQIYTRLQPQFAYANAALMAAAYREGTITIDGKERRVVLVDFNSNGRFGDEFSVDARSQGPESEVYPQWGDMLFIDPRQTGEYRSPYDSTANDDQFQFAKMIMLDGRYYDVSVTPAGDQLTLKPSSTKTGWVTNPNEGYKAIVYNDTAMLEIVGDASGRAPLPVGEWKLLSYTLQREAEPPSEDETAKDEAAGSVLSVLMRAVTDAALRRAAATGPLLSTVSARGTVGYQPVRVVEGETVEMPFGPPFRAEVTADYPQGNRVVSLGMTLKGASGEVCSNLIVNSSRPAAPAFTITTEDGTEVASGVFEYG